MKKRPTYEGQKKMASTKSNEEVVRKVKRDVISHKVGRGKQVDENGF